MKIKDLDPKTNLKDVWVKTNTGIVGKWAGQWPKGVWLSLDGTNTKVDPVIVDQITEVLEWDVVEPPIVKQ